VAELTEEEILAKAVQGDNEAFSVLYERYVGRIYNYIFYRTGNHNDAEDLTERVFYRAMNAIGTYTNKGIPVSAWLYRIAHNLVANWHRDNSRKQEVELDESLDLSHPGEHLEVNIEQNQEVDKLLKMIRKLPAERQQLIILKYVEGLSNAEIAVITGRSEGAIKSLYHRTLESLRNEFDNG
jgi:RNA polymerase sigma-70 factor, ECF subfamily